MTRLQDYDFPSDVISSAGPVALLFDLGHVKLAETSLATTMLWALQQVEDGLWEPDKADQLFTLLDIYLVDNHRELPLSEEARELLFEGALFHHYGGPDGPDPVQLRQTAEAILRRSSEAAA